MGALLVLGVAAAALAVAGVFSGDSGDGTKIPRPAAPPRAVATINAGDGPDGITVDGNTVWVANSQGNAVTRLDARSNTAIGAPVPVGRNPDSVAVADGVVWVTNTDDGTVTHFEADPEPGIKPTVQVGSGPEGLSLGDKLLWVANGDSDSVSRIDRASATTVGEPIARGEQADRPVRRRGERLGDQQLQRNRDPPRPLVGRDDR